MLLAERMRFACPHFILCSLHFVEEALRVQAILLGRSELNLLTDWSLGIELHEVAMLLNTALVSLFGIDGCVEGKGVILAEL